MITLLTAIGLIAGVVNTMLAAWFLYCLATKEGDE
jgi:hypothetical protein